jgi:exopolysaccharide production protein ExoZ
MPIMFGIVVRVPYPSIASFYTSSIMGEFALGMGLGWLMTSSSTFARLPVILGYPLAACGLAGVVALFEVGSLPRFCTSGVAAFLLVGGVLILERHGKVPLVKLPHLLGNASYSIYLSQLMSMSLFSQVWRKVVHDDGPVTWIAFCFLCVCFSGACGVGVYYWLEKPLLNFCHRLTQGRPVDGPKQGKDQTGKKVSLPAPA